MGSLVAQAMYDSGDFGGTNPRERLPPHRSSFRGAAQRRARNPYVDGPRPARGGAACETDRLRSYVRSVVAVAHDRCQDGFRDASSKHNRGIGKSDGFHGVSRVWDRSITLICIVSSKLRPQREGGCSRVERVKRWLAREAPGSSGTAGARGAARSPQQAERCSLWRGCNAPR